jgi:hypothetical protein
VAARDKPAKNNTKIIVGIVVVIVILAGGFVLYRNSQYPSANAIRNQICQTNPEYCNATVIQTNNTRTSSAPTTSVPYTTTIAQTNNYGCAPIPCSYIKNGNFTFVFRLQNGTVAQWYFPVITYNYYVSAPKYTPPLSLQLSNGTSIHTTDYRAMVTPAFFANVIPELTKGKTAEQFLNQVLSIKNQLTVYSTVFENTSVYPAVILGSGEGDCKDFGVLMASLIEAGNMQANYGMQVQFVYVDAYNLSIPTTANHLILHINFENGTSRFIDTTEVFNTTPGGPPPTIGGWYFNLTCNATSCQAGNQKAVPAPTYTGTVCIAYSGFACLNPSLSTSGKLSFTLAQSTGSTFYNVALACVPASQSNGLPNGTFYKLSNPTLANGQITSVSGLPCAGTTAGGTSFKGRLWMNFTPSPGSPSSSNPWISTLFASLYVNAST